MFILPVHRPENLLHCCSASSKNSMVVLVLQPMQPIRTGTSSESTVRKSGLIHTKETDNDNLPMLPMLGAKFWTVIEIIIMIARELHKSDRPQSTGLPRLRRSSAGQGNPSGACPRGWPRMPGHSHRRERLGRLSGAPVCGMPWWHPGTPSCPLWGRGSQGCSPSLH